MRGLTAWKWMAPVVLGSVLVGCGGGGGYREVSEADLAPVEDHHHHDAPHGGLLVEVGAHEYNVEFVFAEAEPQLTVYVLDAHAENPVAIAGDAITVTVKEGEAITAIPLTPVTEGENGKASQFHSTGPLPAHLKSAKDLHGDLKITIGEKTYEVHLHGDEQAHDHDHDHKH